MKAENEMMNVANRIIVHSLWAKWHMASASNGHCNTRRISHGWGDDEFTPDEKRDYAMETAKRHIKYVSDIIDEIERGSRDV